MNKLKNIVVVLALSLPLSVMAQYTDITNVKDYGATGLGDATKDSQAVSDAIAASKGVVYFPSGIYIIKEPIKVYKAVVLTGSGGNSIIKAVDCSGQWPHSSAGNYPLISIRPNSSSFSDVTISNLTLDGSCTIRAYGSDNRNYGSEWNAGIEVATNGNLFPQNVHLSQLHIMDVSGDGITVRGDPINVSHTSVPVEVFIESNFIERWHQNRQGIAIVAGSRINISNNHVVLGISNSGACPATTSLTSDPSSGNFGIDLETNKDDTGDFIAQVQVSNNVIHNCNGGINISNSNYPNNAISTVSIHDNTTIAYSSLPLKPLQVNGSGISNYVEYNNRNDDGFRIYQNAFKFWSDGSLSSSKGAFLSSTGVWTNASSRDYKENIQSFDDSLSLLRQVQVYRYSYRPEHGDDGRMHLGVIAEELPEAVSSADHKGAPTGELIALSLAANRELLKLLEAQADELKSLNEEIEQLKKRLITSELPPAK